MNVSDVRGGLNTRLATISGLHTAASVPDALNQTPAAIVGIPAIDYGQDMTAGSLMTVPILLFAPLAPGAARAQDTMDAFLDSEGAQSVKAAIEADGTLGGAADDCRVVGFGPYDGNEVVGIQMAVARVDVEVIG